MIRALAAYLADCAAYVLARAAGAYLLIVAVQVLAGYYR